MKQLKVLSVFLAICFVLVLTGIAQQQTDETVTCAVGGKEMKKSEVKVTYEYKGETYYFCCAGCKGAFVKDPEKYIHKESHEGQMHTQEKAKDTAVDPVCGMKVKMSEAAATYEYKGKTYYFCMEGCKEKFIKNPEKFTQKKADMKEVYTCSMHPEAKSDKPGKCPECGMKLVKKMMPMKQMHEKMHKEGEEKACCDKEGLSCPLMGFKDVEVKIENLKDGVVFKITSKNAEVVKKIQEMAAKMKTMCTKEEGKKNPVK